jgi:iron complex outermembrane receptor protein
VTGPLSDTVRARFTGYYNDVGGQFENVVTGKDWGGNEGYGGRGKLEWDATPDLNVLLIADYRKLDSDCCRPLLIDAVNPVLATLYAPVVGSPDNRQVPENNQTFATSEQQTYSLQADWDLGFATLTSISAFQNFKIENNVDQDGYDTSTPPVQADVNYQSEVSMGQSDPLLEQDAYTIVDVSAGVKTSDEKYSVKLFVRNVFDETYYTDLTHGNQLADAANPYDLFAQIPKDADRYFGATFGVRF